MHLSVFVSVVLVLVSSLSTYAAPYGTPGTFLDIEQRSQAPLFQLQPRADEHHVVPAVPPQHQHSSVQPHSSTTHEHPGTENAAPARPVYLTSRAFSGSSTSGRNRAVDSPAVFGHWAVVVGNRYYELVFNREVQNEASTSQSVQGQGIRLRVGSAPMVGWHVPQLQGTTTWTDQQIHAAAVRLISQMSTRSYNILTNNCHDFANALIRCITTGGQTRHCTVL
ncbi:hypothetical protein F5887DRAFT_978887 [Amanita rubescens]|nr:hypothetical protein F5887DRAFT_978887 [Amanita rubescens]